MNQASASEPRPPETALAPGPTLEVRWRLAEPTDLPFVYRLVTQVDPRWYRFSRNGLEPSGMLELLAGIAAGAVVLDDYGQPIACALLTDAGSSGTGAFEYFALPTPQAQQLARSVAPDLLAAVFSASKLRRLYVERFDNDPMVLGEAAHLFEAEVVLPDFLRIDGIYEARTTLVLTAERWWPWHEARTTTTATPDVAETDRSAA